MQLISMPSKDSSENVKSPASPAHEARTAGLVLIIARPRGKGRGA